MCHSCLACIISSADLSAICGTIAIVKSRGPMCRPSVASRQILWADFSAYRSQRVKSTSHLLSSSYLGVTGSSLMLWSSLVEPD